MEDIHEQELRGELGGRYVVNKKSSEPFPECSAEIRH